MTDPFDLSTLDTSTLPAVEERPSAELYADLARVVAARVAATKVEAVLRPEVQARMLRTVQQEGYAPAAKLPWGTVSLDGWEPQPVIVDEAAFLRYADDRGPAVETVYPGKPLTVFDPEPPIGSVVLEVMPTVFLQRAWERVGDAWRTPGTPHRQPLPVDWTYLVNAELTASGKSRVYLLWKPTLRLTAQARADFATTIVAVPRDGDEPAHVVDTVTGERDVPGVALQAHPKVVVRQPSKAKKGADRPADAQTVDDVLHYAGAAGLKLETEEQA